MAFSTLQRACGILGLLIMLVGVIVAYLGVPLVDWLSLAVGSVLLAYAIYTGDRVLLFDRIRPGPRADNGRTPELKQ
jgi:uncharacterized membrane protein